MHTPPPHTPSRILHTSHHTQYPPTPPPRTQSDAPGGAALALLRAGLLGGGSTTDEINLFVNGVGETGAQIFISEGGRGQSKALAIGYLPCLSPGERLRVRLLNEKEEHEDYKKGGTRVYMHSEGRERGCWMKTRKTTYDFWKYMYFKKSDFS
ncbi:hypothetical protein T492DRAFT_848487 [Pavlovales sp. CCMP2436]|nr:hypothetical protein T492DRAFT_848487 [Pavlovales sp. CCMP2436]